MKIKDGRELAIAFGSMAALAIVVMAPIGLFIGPAKGDNWLHDILIGTIFAAICGFAYWLSWGGSHVFFRLVVVGAGVVFLCIGLGVAADGHSEILAFATVTLGTAVVVALPRLVGVTRARLGPDGLPEVSRRSRQFSMLDLFVWTTTAALLAAIVRWADVPNKLHGEGELLIWSARLGIATLLAMWATLAMGRWGILRSVLVRLAIAVAVMVAMIHLFSIALGGRFRADPDETIGLAAAQLMIAGYFYILRRRGMRLVRGRAARVVEPGAAMTAATANQYDHFNIRQLYAAVGCFAVAAAIVGICFAMPDSSDIGDTSYLWLPLLSPAIGAFVGLGIGCLIGRKIWGTVLGFVLPLIWLVGFLLTHVH